LRNVDQHLIGRRAGIHFYIGAHFLFSFIDIAVHERHEKHETILNSKNYPLNFHIYFRVVRDFRGPRF
jgi:hypothetical protein